jgi:hypothetical protein
MRRLKTILALVGVLVAVVIVALLGFSHAESGHLGVVVAGRTTNNVGAVLAVLEITNRSPYRVCLPDSCSVESKGLPGSVSVPTVDVWIKPGDIARLPVLAPQVTAEWRVAVGYYSESPWNRFKNRLSSSSLGRKLPNGLVSVQGGMEWSPWITN